VGWTVFSSLARESQAVFLVFLGDRVTGATIGQASKRAPSGALTTAKRLFLTLHRGTRARGDHTLSSPSPASVMCSVARGEVYVGQGGPGRLRG
jgi:hypothetical protein